MAGDWIPIRDDIATVREVVAISQRINWSRREVIGALVQFWGWAQRETTDGRIVDAGVDALVDLFGIEKNFWHALIDVGWLIEGVDGAPGITIPNFETWLSESAKSRLQKNKRQKRWRQKAAQVDAHVVRKASTTEQNRTEQNISIIERAGTPTAAPARVKVAERIFLTEDERARLLALCDGDERALNDEIQKASDWTLSKGKQHKDCAAFMRNWIRRAMAINRRVASVTKTSRYLPVEE